MANNNAKNDTTNAKAESTQEDKPIKVECNLFDVKVTRKPAGDVLHNFTLAVDENQARELALAHMQEHHNPEAVTGFEVAEVIDLGDPAVKKKFPAVMKTI